MVSFLNLNFFYIKKIPFFLIILLPPALVSGPAIPDILISIIGLSFIVTTTKNKQFFYFYHPISILFFLFYLVLLISGLLSEMAWVSLIERETIFYFRFFIFSLAICYYVQHNQKLFYYLAVSLFLTILIIVIDGSVEYFTGTSLFGVKSGDTRLFSLFIDEAIVGRYISSATMLCVALFIYHYGYENNKAIFFIFTILMIGEVFTFMSGERSALAMIGTYSIMAFILISKRRLERIIFIFLSILFIFTLINSEDRTQRRYTQTVNELSEREFPYILAAPVHEAHYKSAYLMFRDNPILGIGSNLFRHMCDKDEYFIQKGSCTTHPHHYYFQILGENGILGFIIFSSFLIFLIFNLTKHFLGLIFNNTLLKIDDRQLLFYIFLFSMISPIWPSGSFYHNWTNIPLFIGLGIFLTFYIASPSKNHEK